MTKQSTITLGIAVGIIALGVLLVYAQPGNREQTNPPDGSGHNILSTDKIFHDFGTISMKNGEVSTTFKVKNTQSEAADLVKLYTSCMCTTAALKLGSQTLGPFGMLGHGPTPTFSETLSPGEEAEIQVTFDPNAHGPAGVGTIERSVTLEGKRGVLATVKIKANVTP